MKNQEMKHENRINLCLFHAAVAFLLCASSTFAAAQNEGVLYSFLGGATDGGSPYAGLIPDQTGGFYGTAFYYGEGGHGIVYQLNPPSGGGTWNETVLYSFTGGADGSGPASNLVMDSAGALYGTTSGGGTFNCGTLYQLLPPSAGGAWTENSLVQFPCAKNDYSSVPGNVVRDPSTGIIYGVVQQGGTANGGWIYELAPSGGAWTYTVLHNFNSYPNERGYANGCTPWSIILAPGGGLYGTALYCGVNQGVVYRLSPPTAGHTNWNETVLHTFGLDPDGNTPYGLVVGKGGVLYGATASGGNGFESHGSGIVYSLTPSGGTWTETILYSFAPTNDGNTPDAVILGPNGSLYGATAGGGSSEALCGAFNGCGTVYQLTPGSGGVWTETILHDFAPTGGDAINPNPGPILLHNGSLYGGSYNGGANGNGAVYAVHP
jgi:uncharacterized repeat protein (TIGR03803 family)